MSSALAEFLRSQADTHRAQAKANRAAIEDWQRSVGKLFDMIQEWLKNTDTEGLLEVEVRDHEITEEGLGRYRIPRLDIRGLGKWVGIIPKARYTIDPLHCSGRFVA